MAPAAPSSSGSLMSVSEEVPNHVVVNGKEQDELHMDTAAVLAKRRALIGPNTATNYDTPLHIVRGQGCHLYDAQGVDYLDCVNNVAHVGHCHPKVAEAVCRQMHTLNTNSRYLHQNLVTYAEMLTSTMPPELSTLYLVCSGSEANDLALRIAHARAPAAAHVAIVGGAYHGHTTSLIDLSPYKYEGPGGEGRKPHVHVLPCPDPLRGEHLDGCAAARAAIAEAHAAGGRIGAFFCESVLSCGGQIVLPEGWLAGVYEEMRGEGALCVADEVQCGFGRAGSHFWAFQQAGVVPDILTLGKSIGNGFPMGGVVTRREHAAKFSNGMEYFNTCGGCTAASAAGAAVLDVIREERLQEAAARVGQYLTARLLELQKVHAVMGEVRGTGLMLGIEIVEAGSLRHAPAAAHYIKQAMVKRRVLLSTDGPYNNVIKIKPPMCFAEPDVDRLVQQLALVLEEGVPEAVRARDAAWNAKGGPALPKTVKP